MISELSFVLLGLALAALWFPFKQIVVPILALTGLILGLVSGHIEWSGAVVLIAFSLVCAFHTKSRLIGHLLFLGLASLLMLHKAPGFQSLTILKHHRFSFDTLPYTLTLSWDKAFIGLAFLFFNLKLARSWIDWKRALQWAVRALIPCVALTLAGAYLSGYVRFDLKIPLESRLWIFKNLLLVCIAEEALFRGYLQSHLAELTHRFQLSSWWAVAASALVFGVSHFAGGGAYIALATLAGFFYGWAYLKSGRIEASILTHFLLNAIHFFVFSYPALQR